MKRDMDLVLKILRSVEDREDAGVVAPVAVEGYTAEQIGFHVWLLVDAGRLEGEDRGGMATRDTAAITLGVLPTRVTTFWKLPIKLPRTRATGTGTNLRQ